MILANLLNLLRGRSAEAGLRALDKLSGIGEDRRMRKTVPFKGSPTPHDRPGRKDQKPGPRFEAGRMIGDRYRITALLGRGGMGEVYRADDLRLSQAVALKFLPSDSDRDPERHEFLLHEVRIARRLTHPNVCRIYDLEEHDGQIFLSMELVEGGSLEELLRKSGRLDPERVLDLALEICAGLASAHGQGIVHRDLKPNNLLLDPDGRVRVGDFGLTMSENSLDPSYRVGTPPYMAPEQRAGREVTVRSDVYSLGLILAEMIRGSRVKVAAEPEEIDFPPSTPQRLMRAVRRCLALDPKQRPASAEAVARLLRPEAATGVAAAGLRAVALFRGLDVDAETEALLESYGGAAKRFTDDTAWLFERPWDALDFALKSKRSVGIDFGEVQFSADADEETAGGEPVRTAAALARLASPDRIFMTQSAFDLARQGAVGESRGKEDLKWCAHGAYRLPDIETPVVVYQVGFEDVSFAPPAAGKAGTPTDSAAAKILGWRPGPGIRIPQRPNWKIERKLGEGGFGEAWLAQHVKTRQRRVIKFCWDQEQLVALQREITVFRLLKEELGEREDIVRLIDWNIDSAPYFIESEYAADGDLREWAQQQGGLDRIPWETKIELVVKTAEALGAAHSVGVLHKDVKPENILVGRRDGKLRVQLMDFGVGAILETERLRAAGITLPYEASSTEAGSRLYMAPEVIEGRTATVQADVYALGVLLYQIVVGDFGRALAAGWDREIEDSLLRQDIAEAVDGRMERRFAGASQLANRLRRLESRRLAENRAKAWEVDRRQLEEQLARLRRRSGLSTIIAATALILCAIMAWTWSDLKRETMRPPWERHLGFETGVDGWAPVGWQINPDWDESRCAVAADSSVAASGDLSAHLVLAPEGSRCRLMQVASADAFRGRRVRVRAALRTEDQVSPSGDVPEIALRITAQRRYGRVEAACGAAVRGGDWTSAELVVHVPQDAWQIQFGVVQISPGQSWADDVEFEVVPGSVETTASIDPGSC